jgi:hypothetical protein
MPYLSNYERQAEQRGLERGLAAARNMLLESLRHRFGEVPGDVTEGVHQVDDYDRVQELFKLSLEVPDLPTFRSRLE